MKKKIVMLVVAVFVLAALILAYYSVKLGRSDETESKETLLELTVDKIQAISWTPKDGEKLSFHRIDGQWSYDGDRELELDQTAMNTVCSGLTGVTVYQKLENVTDLAQYGLDEPEYVLEVTDTEGNTTEVALGDEKTVYSVMATLKTAIAKELEELKAKEE